MPDVRLSDDGGHEVVYWFDEICSSCLAQNRCELVRAIVSQSIVTASGIHIIDCNRYAPDVESPFYIDWSADAIDMTIVGRRSLEAMAQKMSSTMSDLKDMRDDIIQQPSG